MPQFIGASMPASFPGELTRGFFDHTIESKANDKTNPVLEFGVPVKFNATYSAICPVTASSDKIIGFSVRNYGQVDYAGVQKEDFLGVLKRGYFAAKIATSETVTPGSQVYVSAAGKLTSVASGGTAVTGAVFCGAAQNGIVEIAYNL